MTLAAALGMDAPDTGTIPALTERRSHERAGNPLPLEALHDEMANWSSAETQEALAAFPELTVDQWMWAQRGVRRSVQVLTRDQRRSG